MQARDWGKTQRASFWLKQIGLLAGAIIGIATAARICGINVDLQTKTAAAAEHQAIKSELRGEIDRSVQRVERDVHEIKSNVQDIHRVLMRGRR